MRGTRVGRSGVEIRVASSARVMDGAVARVEKRDREARARAFDLALLVLFSPLILIVAIAIAIAIFVDSPGSVIFRSTRVGRHGRPFTMYKFRKMRAGAHGHSLTLAD